MCRSAAMLGSTSASYPLSHLALLDASSPKGTPNPLRRSRASSPKGRAKG